MTALFHQGSAGLRVLAVTGTPDVATLAAANKAKANAKANAARVNATWNALKRQRNQQAANRSTRRQQVTASLAGQQGRKNIENYLHEYRVETRE